MADRWDDIEILRAIDRLQQERFGGARVMVGHGLWLMEEINGGPVIERQQWRGFVQELHIARDRGLLNFKVQHSPRPNLADVDSYYYLQAISDFALTVRGQDRARGRVVVQPLPDPGEDDGRQLSSLIFKQIAAAITEEYAPDEVADGLTGVVACCLAPGRPAEPSAALTRRGVRGTSSGRLCVRCGRRGGPLGRAHDAPGKQSPAESRGFYPSSHYRTRVRPS